MSKIHHATAKRAQAEGFRIEHDELTGLFVVFDLDTDEEVTNAATAKAALDDAIAVRDSDDDVVPTTRDEDGVDEDGEPVETDEEDEEPEPGSIVPAFYKDQYKENDGTCGDPIAFALKRETTVLSKGKKGASNSALDHQALLNIATDHGFNPLELWPNLNPGQWRMNTGNKLRGIIAKGGQVELGGTIFTIDAMPDTPRWRAARQRLAKAKAKAEAKAGFVDGVKAHALAHYDEDGWDFIVETMENDELAKLIAKASDLKHAISIAADHAKAMNEQREAAQNA